MIFILYFSDNYDWMRKFTTRNPMRSKQHMPLAFNKIEPEVLANQLTYLEWKTLRRISVSFAFLNILLFTFKLVNFLVF